MVVILEEMIQVTLKIVTKIAKLKIKTFKMAIWGNSKI